MIRRIFLIITALVVLTVGGLAVYAVHEEKLTLSVAGFKPMRKSRIVMLAVRIHDHARRLINDHHVVVLKKDYRLHRLRTMTYNRSGVNQLQGRYNRDEALQYSRIGRCGGEIYRS